MEDKEMALCFKAELLLPGSMPRGWLPNPGKDGWYRRLFDGSLLIITPLIHYGCAKTYVAALHAGRGLSNIQLPADVQGVRQTALAVDKLYP